VVEGVNGQDVRELRIDAVRRGAARALERGIPTAAPTLDLRDREPADPTIGSAA